MLGLDPGLPFLEINADQRSQEYLLHHFFFNLEIAQLLIKK